MMTMMTMTKMMMTMMMMTITMMAKTKVTTTIIIMITMITHFVGYDDADGDYGYLEGLGHRKDAKLQTLLFF